MSFSRTSDTRRDDLHDDQILWSGDWNLDAAAEGDEARTRNRLFLERERSDGDVDVHSRCGVHQEEDSRAVRESRGILDARREAGASRFVLEVLPRASTDENDHVDVLRHARSADGADGDATDDDVRDTRPLAPSDERRERLQDWECGTRFRQPALRRSARRAGGLRSFAGPRSPSRRSAGSPSARARLRRGPSRRRGCSRRCAPRERDPRSRSRSGASSGRGRPHAR